MPTSVATLDICTHWAQALPFERFVATSNVQQDLWRGLYQQARIPAWASAAAARSGIRRLLVIAEDWCNDAVSTVPVLARLAESVPGMELRILRRDEHPELMDEYLTDGARAIPIVLLLDAACEPIGVWGPRPPELQEWVMANRGLDKTVRNREVRKWYARDRGESVLRGVLGDARCPRCPR